jgi:hypothetical protein
MLIYALSNTTTEPPANGQMRMNGPQTTATLIWLNYLTDDGLDAAGYYYMLAKTDGQIYVQDKNDRTVRQRYLLTADAVDKGTYAEFAVSWISGNGTLPASPSQDLSVILAGVVTP